MKTQDKQIEAVANFDFVEGTKIPKYKVTSTLDEPKSLEGVNREIDTLCLDWEVGNIDDKRSFNSWKNELKKLISQQISNAEERGFKEGLKAGSTINKEQLKQTREMWERMAEEREREKIIKIIHQFTEGGWGGKDEKDWIKAKSEFEVLSKVLDCISHKSTKENELPKIKIKKLVGLKKFKKMCKGFREAMKEEDKWHKHEKNGLEPDWMVKRLIKDSQHKSRD